MELNDKTTDLLNKVEDLIRKLKDTCRDFGIGNDGSEYRVITQVFLYKFLNDKFGYEIKKDEKFKNTVSWDDTYSQMSAADRENLLDRLDVNVPRLEPEHLLSYLLRKREDDKFNTIFDDTMIKIAERNEDIFHTWASDGTDIPLLEKLTPFVNEETRRLSFARALIDNLGKFSLEATFDQNYDFFATIFEYLIKDYNTAGGGTYAEYYTPLSIATIMARLLVGDKHELHSVKCYDPSAGTGTLLMALSHRINETSSAGGGKCSIYAQDISQKSNKMLKLNLILNGLISSLPNAIQGDTLLDPYYGFKGQPSTFDYVVSNPPFNMDFSKTRDDIASMKPRWWAQIPKVPPKKPERMPIYTCFIQHVVNSLSETGKAAIVVPTGFITAKNGPENEILQYLVNKEIVYGCISMPSNIFANTGTNVSVLFLDKSKSAKSVILIDASKLGEEYKEGRNKKRRLRNHEIDKIVSVFLEKKVVEDFSVVKTYDEIRAKKYSLAAGQYFDIKFDHVELSQDEFKAKIKDCKDELQAHFEESKKLQEEIMSQMEKLKYE